MEANLEPNRITRAIIDATLDRGLKEIDEDPQRSMRKLADLGRAYSGGTGFPDEIYAIIQNLLHNDDSPYYPAMQKLLRNADRKNLKDYCINIGYDSIHFGGMRIRATETEYGFHVPWAITLRTDPARPDSITAAEIENCVQQGKPLGIFSYFIRLAGNISSLEELLDIFRREKLCAFTLLLPDTELTQEQIRQIRTCTNVLILAHASGYPAERNAEHLLKAGVLFGMYEYYSDATAAEWSSGRRLADFKRFDTSVVFLVPSDDCSAAACEQTAKFVREFRSHPRYPFLLFDLRGDMLQFDRLISEDAHSVEILENGDVLTEKERISDFRNTLSLKRLLSYVQLK